MASLFRRTRLYAQIQEACAAKSALRRSEHRLALKAQRQLVRIQVLSEIQRARIQALTVQMAAAQSEANVQAARNVAEAERARRRVLASLAQERGAELPSIGGAEAPAEYKQRMLQRVQASVPEGARGVAAGRLLDSVLTDGLRGVPLAPGAHGGEMGADLAVGLARQAGVSGAELEEMLRKIRPPDDDGANDYLRQQILPRLRETEPAADAAGATAPTPREAATAAGGASGG